jgi:phosphatidylglycerophosphatase A
MSFSRTLASGAGVGFAPRAPGTFGSLIGLALGALFLALGHLPLALGALVVSAAGVWAVDATGAAQSDPGWVVVDEIAGQMIAMLALPRSSLPGIVVAFALFRLFDITKPGPIGWADARHDAWGVMADDWLAGFAAALVIWLLGFLLRTSWL